MRNLIYIFIVLCTLISCERRPLEESFIETVKIPVNIDWSAIELDANNDKENLYRASVYLFANSGTPFNGISYKEYPLNSPKGGEIEVPIGDFAIVIFNNSTTEFSENVGFRGKESYHTFEYFVNSDNTRSENNKVLEPDIIGAWRSSSFIVTPDMVLHSRSGEYSLNNKDRTKANEDLKQLTTVTPERLTKTLHINISTKNINSATSASGKLIGMAHSVKMASAEQSANGASFVFGLKNRVYDDGSTKDGTVEATFQSLGMLACDNAKYYVELRFNLAKEYNGSKLYPADDAPPFRFNISEQLKGQENFLKPEVKLGFDDEEIVLPDLNISGGFDPDIGDWGDEEWIDIPI